MCWETVDAVCTNNFHVSENDKAAVKFYTLPESFCSRRTPDYAEAYVSSVNESKWVKMIEYESGFIEVELCGCRYKLPDDSYEYTYYGQSPDDEYYEVRLWNFVRDYESDEWWRCACNPDAPHHAS